MVDVYQKKIDILGAALDDEQLKSIHFRSLQNFLKYFSCLKNDTIKKDVLTYLNKYFEDIEARNYKLTQFESHEIYQDYIMKIGTFYKAQLNFQVYMEPKWALFIGLNIDLILLILGVLKKLYFIPIVTLLFTGYFLFINLFYKKRDKIYGSGI